MLDFGYNNKFLLFSKLKSYKCCVYLSLMLSAKNGKKSSSGTAQGKEDLDMFTFKYFRSIPKIV